MTNPYLPQPGPGQAPATKQESKARSQAEKAHRKALRPWYKKKRFILPLALVGLIFFVNVLSPDDPAPTTAFPAGNSTSASAPATTAAAQPTEEATEDAEADAEAQKKAEEEAKKKADEEAKAEAKAKKAAEENAKAEAEAKKKAEEEAAKPKLSREQENAIRSAESYLELKGFSRQGLIEQLSSEYGDGYPKKVATFAVDSLDINYNKQAARAAESYLDLKGFSCKGLIEQLSSDFGDGYTRAQAEYGAGKAGVC